MSYCLIYWGVVIDYLGLFSPNLMVLALVSQGVVGNSMGFLSPHIVVLALYPRVLWLII